jgi:Zn-dependent protease
MVLVAAAGPLSNLLMAIFWAGIVKIGLNVNSWFGVPLIYMGQAGMMINIVLCVLNCLPIPPLDGGRALTNLLPGRAGWYLYRLEPYGFLILVILMLSGVLSFVIEPIIYLLMRWLSMVFGLAS